MPWSDTNTGLLDVMTRAAHEAGELAMRYFREAEQTSAAIQYKDGGSPVTEADVAVDDLLKARLRPLIPVGWLSEETADNADRLDLPLAFIVDPIDGTRAFIRGDKRWGISLALVENGKPVLGVLFMPALRQTYAAAAGRGATMNGASITASVRTDLKGARIAGPIKAMDGLDQQGFGILREPRIPSLAYRLARIALGDIDAAIASTDAYDWDIAAAHLLIREAGGCFTDLDMRAPVYNAAVPRHKALTAAGPHMHSELVAAIRKLAANS